MTEVTAPVSVELRSRDRRSVLRIDSIRSSGPEFPSLEVSVEAELQDFSGRATAWLDGAALDAFVTSLRELEPDDQGALELQSMSPDEFRLVVRSVDRVGHLAAEFTITKTTLVGDEPDTAPIRLIGTFELERGQVAGLVDGFTALAACVGE